MAITYTVDQLVNATEDWKENLKQTDIHEYDNWANQYLAHISGSQNLQNMIVQPFGFLAAPAGDVEPVAGHYNYFHIADPTSPRGS